MCSSARYSVGSPFLPFSVTATTSSWNTQSSQARLARCCDPSATSSTSFRVSLYFSARSEEHTSELQSPCNIVCRLLLEKKKSQFNFDSNDTVTLAIIRRKVESLEHRCHDD